jgi:hypothetical protein
MGLRCRVNQQSRVTGLHCVALSDRVCTGFVRMTAQIISKHKTVDPMVLINQHEVEVGRKGATNSEVSASSNTGLAEVLPSNG